MFVKMLFLTPKSSTATLRSAFSSPKKYASCVHTWEDNSKPSMEGILARAAFKAASSKISEEIKQFITPFVRM